MRSIYADTLGFIGGKMGPPEFTPEVFERIRESGVRIIGWGGPHPAHEKWHDLLGEVLETERQLEVHPDLFRIVRSGRDLNYLTQTNLIYVVMGVQNPYLIEDEWYRLTKLREAGVRVMQLAYLDERDNIYGCGFWTQEDTGLTRLGRRYLKELADRGFILDLSHTGERTALEALDIYTGRIMISHTGSHQVYNHPRNATTEVIKAVSRRDGIIGVYTMTFFLDQIDNGLGPWLRHVHHILSWAGPHCITVGSDAPVGGFIDIEAAKADFPKLTASLERGRPIDPKWAPRWPAFTPAFDDADRFRVMERELVYEYGRPVARRITGENALRFYRDTIK